MFPSPDQMLGYAKPGNRALEGAHVTGVQADSANLGDLDRLFDAVGRGG
jgi:hypothetical protein